MWVNLTNSLEERLFLVVHTSCSETTCLKGRICMATPSNQSVCITPGRTFTTRSSVFSSSIRCCLLLDTNSCGSACHTRGICSNGECVCSNRTYTGDDCEMCRISETVRAGCFQVSGSPSAPCMCYLSRSKVRQTPYLCIALKENREETGWYQSILWPSLHRSDFDRIEVPCDRIASPSERESCSRNLFDDPVCERPTHSLIFHVGTQSCICRETIKRRPVCFNDGLLIINGKENSTSCSWVSSEELASVRWSNPSFLPRCSLPYSGPQCQWNSCGTPCRNNATCLSNGTTAACK